MMGFRFQDPAWLIAIVPLVAAALWVARRRGSAVLYSEVSLLHLLPETPALWGERLLPWIRIAGLILMAVAMARPQRGMEEFRVQAEGIAILMCIDRSDSMETMDYKLDGRPASRLEIVRRVFRDFVNGKGRLPGRPDDLIGLISFGGYAECRCPLTLDHGALLRLLDTVQVTPPPDDSLAESVKRGLDEERLTAIGDALTVAIQRLKDVQAKSKVIVLLSDGRQTTGAVEPADAAQTARDLGIKIYTIGMEIDEAALKSLADTTGGRSFKAEDTKALEDVYAEIDRLEKGVVEGRRYSQYRELYQYVMYSGWALILLEVVLRSTRLRSLP
jgi:Ca-activated chloride channel family protein